MGRAKKYIVLLRDNKPILRFGYPLYHRDLLDKKESLTDIIGGGYWELNNSEVELFGKSDEFGEPNKKDLLQAIDSFKDLEYLEWIYECIHDIEVRITKIRCVGQAVIKET